MKLMNVSRTNNIGYYFVEINPALSDEERMMIIEYLKKYNKLENPSLADTRIIVRDKDYRIVGYGEIDFLNWYRAETKHVFVIEGHRQRGLGKLINKILFRLARKKNVKIISCTVRKENIPSIRMVESVGFKEYTQFTNPITGNRIKVYYKNLEDKDD